jgi:hypothetical protein
VSMAVDARREVPDLPVDWLPDDALVMAIARRRASEGLWEVILPEFLIVGRGDSFHAAIDEACDLLEDYLRICASEGRSFDECRRPIAFRWMARLIAHAAASSISRRVPDRRKRTSGSRVLRFPVGHAPC